MNQCNTSGPDQEEPLADVGARNRRHVRGALLAVCLVAAVGLSVRLASYLATRPPNAPAPLKSIPGYYTEDQVMAFITNGVSMTTLIAHFGPPTQTSSDPRGFTSHHFWHFPTDGGGPYRNTFCGFSVTETNGIVLRKGSEHVTMQ